MFLYAHNLYLCFTVQGRIDVQHGVRVDRILMAKEYFYAQPTPPFKENT